MLLKKLQDFEKMLDLVTNIFSFSRNVSYDDNFNVPPTFSVSSSTTLNLGESRICHFGKELTYYHTKPHFVARYIVLENIARKGEIACNKQFLLFSQYFLPYMVLIFHFKCTLKCRLQFVSIWISLILSSGNGLTPGLVLSPIQV